MLVLTRKSKQEILIDGNICLTVLGIGGGRVKIGITAPRNVDVIRKEAARGAHVPLSEDRKQCIYSR